MRKSTIILIVGLVILVAGAVMSVCKIEPYADYVLVAGAVVVIARGFVRTHEAPKPTDETKPEDAGQTED